MRITKPSGSTIPALEARIALDGAPVALSAYPHRQTKKGVSVAVNRAKRSVVKGGFVATMRSGHKGIFRRRGAGRLPISELYGSRPVDALLHPGEARGVVRRGLESYQRTLKRLLLAEISKDKGV